MASTTTTCTDCGCPLAAPTPMADCRYRHAHGTGYRHQHDLAVAARQAQAIEHSMVRLARWAATVEAIHVEADAKALQGPPRAAWIAMRRAECLEPF